MSRAEIEALAQDAADYSGDELRERVVAACAGRLDEAGIARAVERAREIRRSLLALRDAAACGE